MPPLKEIRRRIKSIKSTQKITQAMYMIATTKLKKAETRVVSSRPFSIHLLHMFQRLLEADIKFFPVSNISHAIDNYPALMEKRELKSVGILVIASNKGLSGTYNTNIVKETLELIHEYQLQGLNVKLFIIGQRAYNALKRNPNAEILKLYNNLNELITPGESAVIAEDLAEAYVSKSIDKIFILTTEYLTKMNNIPVLWTLLPLTLPKFEKTESHELKPEMIIEPSPELVIQKVLPLYLSNRIYQAIIEAYTSELASRMAAMKSATDNAEEMINSLTLKYNKLRQNSITQEIVEVVSGSDALK